MCTRIILSRWVGICIFTACMLIVHSYTAARPVVLEETAKITSPDPNYPIVDVAIDGNDLLALGFNPDLPDPQFVLFHFERESDGSWLSRGSITTDNWGHYYSWVLAFENGIGLFRPDPFSAARMLERTASGWKVTDFLIWPISDALIRESTIVVGTEDNGFAAVYLLQKDSTGAWVRSRAFVGARGFGDDDFFGPDIEFTPTEAIAAHLTEDFQTSAWPPISFVFDRVNGQWTHTSTLNAIYPTAAIDGRVALRLADWNEPGDIASFFTRAPDGSWTVRYSLLTEEWFANKRSSNIAFKGDRAYAAMPEDDARGRDAGSMAVFARTAPMRFTQSATLLASDATPDSRLGVRFSVSGGRMAVLANPPSFSSSDVTNNAVYVFELPDPLPEATRLEDTFEDMNSAGWTPWGLTNWRVVSSGGSQTFRQTDARGDARAIFEGFEGANQSIQADLKVNSLPGAGTHWAGLMARYTDSANFYYLMIGANNKLEIRKIVNGAFGPIASTAFTLQIGRTYRFRLEAVGEWLRAYVDDRLMLEVRDTSHPEGRTGLAMWKANAEYDNVIVSTNPYTTLHKDSFSGTADENATPPWVTSPANAWNRVTASGATVFRQSSPSGDARAVHGAPTEDQIVAANVRPLASGPGWAGLMARYVDNSTYYYVYLLDSQDKISLRRWMNGRITVLDEAPLTVTPGTNYRLRVEAIGPSLRAYVNGRLRVEAQDAAIPAGRYGLVTYRATADFDTFEANRP